MPVGVAGEIYLGGIGLARGYVGRPGLTAERFVADPFGAGGGRLYRTGDLGRWRGDGVVEFLGRSDGQVKLRGLRIEPGEIEAALLEHGAVAQAAVVVWRERLVAYVAGRGAEVAAAALRLHLASRLPAHMLPQGYVWLAALPRTASGKLDRRALPEPVWREAEGFEAPQGAVEELLAALWAELLGRDRVGRHDNFFDLGGHSLLATRLVSRVRGVLGVELALRSVFEHPSLAGLAHMVSGAETASGEALRAGPRPAALPLSFAQQRLWFLEQLEGGSSYTVPMALRLTGPLDAAALAPGARGRGGAARGAAHHLPGGGRGGGAVGRAGRAVRAGPGGCGRGCAGGSAGGAVAAALRPGAGAADRGHAAAARAGACTCWRWWCTTSPSTAGRRRSCCRSCRRSTARRWKAARRGWRRWRCSMPITRCGSGGITRRRATWRTGGRRWPGRPTR